MSDSPEEIRKHLKIYWGIFAALLIFTAITVAAARVGLQPYVWALTVGLAIACIKGSLVGGFFMHLIGEKKLIYWVLILTGALNSPSPWSWPGQA